MSNNKPVIALLYDFDKTLCTKDMQEYTFIPNVHMTAEEFWRETTEISRSEKMDKILVYMRLMLEKAHQNRISIRENEFVKLGKDLEFYPGVEEWFDNINAIGELHGVIIEHYIISSGLREIIEGSSISKHFTKIYGCEFLYDENDVACWPKNAVNYTTKTQFLFRINKGVLDLADDQSLNEHTPQDDRRVPFRNMIYIGDGMTDVPCMRLVKEHGGYSIAVHKENDSKNANKLLLAGRVNFSQNADYRKGEELYITVENIIRKMVADDYLIRKSKRQYEEAKLV